MSKHAKHSQAGMGAGMGTGSASGTGTDMGAGMGTPGTTGTATARPAQSHARQGERGGRKASENRSAQANPQTASFGSCTDIGCVRDHNEDSLLVQPPLYVVADGMGGHAAGEVASEIAVQVIAAQAPHRMDSEALGAAVESANREILNAAMRGQGRQGMGTTVTAAMLQGERLILAQVGDSRAYLLHQGHIQQLTRDHSLMADLIEAGRITPEEAKTHPQRNVITRALGSAPYTRPDLYELNVETGDRLLLCSDGLSGMVPEKGLETALATVEDPQLCANHLINMAVRAGGHDNITAIVVDVTGFAEARMHKAKKKTKRTIGIIAAVVVVALCAAFFGFNHYINSCAYLADLNGKVAIYQGQKESFMGMSMSKLVETTEISTNDLAPGTASQLKSTGISVASIDDARKLVEEDYPEYIARSKQLHSNSGSTATGSTDSTTSSASTTSASTTAASTASAPSAASATTRTATQTASAS